MSEATPPRPRTEMLALALVTALCLLPFVNKAYHIDDTVFLRVAEQILREPLDFYGSTMNWFGHEDPMHAVQKNPPLTSYYIAAVAAM
jgi:hypothetical protein